MANKFEIQVVALDRFTKVFRGLNDQASKAVRPVSNTFRQVSVLGREMHLDKIAKGFNLVSRESLNMGRSLGLATGPLESLLGIGAAGGIVGIGAGLVALGARWGRLGYEVSRTSQNLNLGTTDLQRYRGAANLAGVSTEEMTGALDVLGTTLQDAFYGRNQLALVVLNKLGVQIRKGADGTIDLQSGFEDVARAISKIGDPRAQRKVAEILGIEAALPLIRMGEEGIARLKKQAEDFGLVGSPTAIKGAREFGDALNQLKAAVEGVANAWGQRLTPMMTRGIQATTAALQTDGVWGALKNFFSGNLSRTALFGPRANSSASGSVSEAGGSPAERAPLLSDGGGRFVDPAVQAQRDAEAMRIIQGEYDTATDPGTKAALGRELGRMRAAASRSPAQAPQAAAEPVKVEISMSGAPPGTNVKASRGNLLLPTRINYSMPTTDEP